METVIKLPTAKVGVMTLVAITEAVLFMPFFGSLLTSPARKGCSRILTCDHHSELTYLSDYWV